ncbi:MAG: transcription antitermination factor NusB, partial [Pirellulales bacterium]
LATDNVSFTAGQASSATRGNCLGTYETDIEYILPKQRGIHCMARRSRAREVALQVLFQDDVNAPESPTETRTFLESRLKNRELVEFAASLVAGVRRNRGELDELLGTTAVNWSLDRMANTDRNVLRMGAYEILYTDTPGRVAINEAVELAKRFGAAQSAPFVNGILDRFLEGHSTNDT